MGNEIYDMNLSDLRSYLSRNIHENICAASCDVARGMTVVLSAERSRDEHGYILYLNK